MKRTFKILGVLTAGALIVLLALVLYYLGVTADVRLDADKLSSPTACVRLYDKRGEEIAVGAAAEGGELPAHVKEAFVAVEDKRFFTNHGVDTRRIFGALWHNLTSFYFKEGASTIYQQII